jgi:2',3'-cyclic-nucleotide 2'-phosphodiesterase (5'-nucleotidase family)
MKINLKILMIFLVVFGFTIQVFGISYAKDITLIYSGETHGMIYPCNCPIEPDGGVARRATLVKQLRQQYPDALLFSTGGFFAGGAMDQYSQNTELDKQRSLIALKALELMKYDAVTIGDDEFNFGKEFLLDNITKNNINFLSVNIKADKIAPYIIKEIGGIKIGIIGVTTLEVSKKVEGLNILDPKEAVASTVKELKTKGANIIILLSHLGEEEDIKLIQEVKGIDVVITGHSLIFKGGPLVTKRGDTLFLRPTWEGRRLDKAVLTVKDNKIVDCKVEEIRLSDKIADDLDILNILPRCFSSADCRKEGLVGSCQNGGSMNAACTFSEPKKKQN